jgi:UDP-galactopyranose mutase
LTFDWLIVGAGLFGSVAARQLTDAGCRCLIIDRRRHTGGNVYTERVAGIDVHRYGPHIFHTNSEAIWQYVQRFGEFNHFVNRPKVRSGDKIYSFPINLLTLHQLWGVRTPAEAAAKLAAVRLPIPSPRNMEEYALSQIGEELYRLFIYGYTKKQWGREPRELPASILKRVPIRLTCDDNYYRDRFQGIPIHGYTAMIESVQHGIPLELGTNYLDDRDGWRQRARNVLYTGSLDALFDYRFGPLEYRTLRFETEVLDTADFQGNAQVNYTDAEIPFTRIVEHKHFAFGTQPQTVVTREFSSSWTLGAEPYYPLADETNRARHGQYCALADRDGICFGGRLADYQYYDMHQVIGAALCRSERWSRGVLGQHRAG